MSDGNEKQNTGRFSHLRFDHLGSAVRRIESGEFIDDTELAELLRAQQPDCIPDKFLEYLCRYLEGKVEKPRGRKAWPIAERRKLDMVIAGWYRCYLARLSRRKRRYGHPAGWTKLTYPPAEMAARLVGRYYFYGEASWRTVQNIASSRK